MDSDGELSEVDVDAMLKDYHRSMMARLMPVKAAGVTPPPGIDLDAMLAEHESALAKYNDD